MKKHCAATLPEIAAGLGVTARSIQLRSKKQAWPNTGETIKGGGYKYDLDKIPLAPEEKIKVKAFLALSGKHPVAADSNPQLHSESTSESALLDDEDRESLWDYYGRKAQNNKAGAARRLKAVRAIDALVASGIAKMEACRIVAERIEAHPMTVYGWTKKGEAVPACDRLTVLVDTRGGHRPRAEVSPEAWEYFKADYLRRDRPTLQSCYERLQRAAQKHDWSIPSLKTLQRKLTREIPHDLVVLRREGEDAYKKCFPAQERDKTVFHALEAVNGDGYTFYKYVCFESGEVCRPTAWIWQDIYASKVLAWRLDVSENKDMIRLSIGDLIERYGIPDHFWLDNTRAAANKDVTGGVRNRYRFKVSSEEPVGLIPQLGAEVHWTTPGHGQAKPVERVFGVGGIGEYVDKHPSFSGRGTKARPIPVAEFEAVLQAEVAAFNARQGRRSKICMGGSFDEAFAESYARSTIKKATREQRALWLLAPETVTANRQDGSIKIMGNRYWCEALSRHKGQKLVARFDPANMHGNVIVYTIDGRRIAEAECLIPAGFNDRTAARDHAKEKARRRKALRAAEKHELRMTAIQAAELLPGDEHPETPQSPKVVRGCFGKGERAAEGDPASRYNFEETVQTMLENQRKSRL